MIIFYSKKTGVVFGVINGRVHENSDSLWIQPDDIPQDNVGKYIVPFKPKYRVEEQPITEMRVVDKKTMRVEQVVVGKKKVKVSAGMEPDVPFAGLISDFEAGKKRIYDYKVKLDKGEVVGFVLK